MAAGEKMRQSPASRLRSVSPARLPNNCSSPPTRVVAASTVLRI
jgi:hypothetical protein